ncbi:MAG TPA: hypothetical protein VIW70_08295, partial [Rubrivivax sp.]
MNDDALRAQLLAARTLARTGTGIDAESAYDTVHRARPDSAEAAIALARIAAERGSLERGESVLATAFRLNPEHEMLAVELAVARANRDQLGPAIEGLRAFVERLPGSPLAWLLLGQMLDDAGRRQPALLARFEAVTRAHAAGVWRRPSETPPHLAGLVKAAVADVHLHRRDVFFGIVEPLRREHGPSALKRIDRALNAYMAVPAVLPPDAMQRPRFFYFPDLPTLPYIDPYLQPWAHRF